MIPAVAGGEPAVHLQQQAARAEEQCRRHLDTRHQLEPRVEGVGEFDPDVRLWKQAVGAIERTQQFLVEAAADPPAGETANIPQGAAPQARQDPLVGGHRREDLHREGIEQLFQGTLEAVLDAGTREQVRGQAVGGPSQGGHPLVGALLDDAVTQGPLAAEQARAALDLEEDSFFGGGNPGCELQGPSGNSAKRLIGRGRAVGPGRKE